MWKGYGSAQNSWIFEEKLNCPDLIEDFELGTRNKTQKTKRKHMNTQKPKQKRVRDTKKTSQNVRGNDSDDTIGIEPNQERPVSIVGEYLLSKKNLKFNSKRIWNLVYFSGVIGEGGQLELLKWKGVGRITTELAARANVEWMELVIAFYEDRLMFVD